MNILKKMLLPLLILSLALLCACTATTPAPTAEPAAPAPTDEPAAPAEDGLAAEADSDTDAPAAPEAEDDQIGSASAGEVLGDESATAAEGSEFYFSDNRVWCIQLPDEWAGKYAVEETDAGVRFYDTANADAGFGGTLFTVCAFGLDEDYEYLPSYLLLGRDVDTNYVVSFPTDVQADPENDELLQLHDSLQQGLDEWLPAHFTLVAR